MLGALPCAFVAGETLDLEAPTGGYLLRALFGSGRRGASPDGVRPLGASDRGARLRAG